MSLYLITLSIALGSFLALVFMAAGWLLAIHDVRKQDQKLINHYIQLLRGNL